MKKAILISIITIIVCSCSMIENDDIPKEYQNIRYQEIENNETKYACITFYDNGKYSMYDCDSEPTNYFFDNENECTYEYDEEDKEIEFDCKYDILNTGENEITDVYIDKDSFEFNMSGEKKTFKSTSWIKENINE